MKRVDVSGNEGFGRISIEKRRDIKGAVSIWQSERNGLLIRINVAASTLPAIISALQAAMQDIPTTDRGEE